MGDGWTSPWHGFVFVGLLWTGLDCAALLRMTDMMQWTCGRDCGRDMEMVGLWRGWDDDACVGGLVVILSWSSWVGGFSRSWTVVLVFS